MLRTVLCALLALTVVAGVSVSQEPKKAAKNQMVKGTIKSFDIDKGVLVVNQKVKNETVERQLDITSKTTFSVTVDGKTEEASGKDGLALAGVKVGASVTIKCDKDVNVLSVKVGK